MIKIESTLYWKDMNKGNKWEWNFKTNVHHDEIECPRMMLESISFWSA